MKTNEQTNHYDLNDDGSITLKASLNMRLWVIASMVSKALGYSSCHVGVLDTCQTHICGRGA